VTVVTEGANVRPVPQGYDTVTPYLIVKGPAAFIDFVVRAFGAEERAVFPTRTARSVTRKSVSAARS
jgi:uncharacterized glyoxalase superfamily protein PhnB